MRGGRAGASQKIAYPFSVQPGYSGILPSTKKVPQQFFGPRPLNFENATQKIPHTR